MTVSFEHGGHMIMKRVFMVVADVFLASFPFIGFVFIIICFYGGDLVCMFRV